MLYFIEWTSSSVSESPNEANKRTLESFSARYNKMTGVLVTSYCVSRMKGFTIGFVNNAIQITKSS